MTWRLLHFPFSTCEKYMEIIFVFGVNIPWLS
jgi:hypothetical protein